MNRVRWVILASMCSLTWIPPSNQTGCGFRIPYDEDFGNTPKSKKQSRSIGGRISLDGEWPWTVSLQVNKKHFCTGSILSPLWILSGAHCYDNGLNHSFVVVGATTLYHREGKRHKVEKVILHPEYSKNTMDSDIALLLLATPVNISRFTTPICLPPHELYNILNWRSCYISGWGLLLQDKKKTASSLENMQMKLIAWYTCKQQVQTITMNMICAKYEDEGQDSCQGDSGGPLFCRKHQGKAWYQVGIASWRSGCGQKHTPGVYTILRNYLTWIEKVTKEEGNPILEDLHHKPPKEGKEAKKENDDSEESLDTDDTKNSDLFEVGEQATEEKSSTEANRKHTEKSYLPKEEEEEDEQVQN